MKAKPEIRGERPLSGAKKAALVVSGVATIGLCYAFSVVSILGLLVLLAVELAVMVGAARFGAAGVITPLIKRHAPLLKTFLRSFWLQKGTDYRLLLHPTDAPRLFVILDQMAQKFNIAPPREVSIEMNSNAWVRLKGYRRGAGRTILAIGYDLLAGLTEGQVEAVLAHEMGHTKFVHRGIKTWLYKGVRRVAALTSQLSAQVESYRNAGETFELAQMFLHFSDQLTRVSARLLATYSRQDEFEADRVSAELFGAESLRAALVRLDVLDEKLRWLPWTERVAQLESEGSFSQWLRQELASPTSEAALTNSTHAHDPYSTHPSLSDRIAALPPDDGPHRNEAPAIELLAEPDRVAAKLIAEIDRILADQEQKDTKSLARWTRKAQRSSNIRLAQAPGLILIGAGILAGLIWLTEGSVLVAASLCAMLTTAGLLAWRWGRYRDRVHLPVPRFAEIKAAWQAERPADLSEPEKNIETEVQGKIASKKDNRQKIALLIDEGSQALGHCEYLRAHVASRLALHLNSKSVEAALVMTTAAAGLRLWGQMEVNLTFVRKRTGLATPSTIWGTAWAVLLAGDWGRAEGFLWQALEKQPENTTFLMLLALAQSQRGKSQSATLNAGKAAALQPGEPEHTKLLSQLLIDVGRLSEAEKHLRAIVPLASSDAEVAMLIVRVRLMRRQFEAALAAADLLRRADDSANWLIRLGEVFETARSDQQAAQFFENALSSGYYPEALLGMARLAARRRDKEEARRYLLSALNLEDKCGPQGRTAVELFHTTVGQLMMLEDPRENCVAWIATFPADAQPAALAQRSLMLYATKRSAAEKHLDQVLSAMQPGSPVTRAAKLQWREAPKHQQPARPVREGVQSVL